MHVIAKIYYATLHDRSVVVTRCAIICCFFHAIYHLPVSVSCLYICLASASANIEAYLSMLISSLFFKEKDYKLFFSEATTTAMFVMTPFLWSPRTLAKRRFLMINVTARAGSSCKHKPLECICKMKLLDTMTVLVRFGSDSQNQMEAIYGCHDQS